MPFNLPTWAKHSMPSTWIYPVKLFGSGCPVSLLCGPHEPHDSYDSSGLRGQLIIPPKLKAIDFHEKRWMSKHSQLKTSRQLQQFSQTKQKQLQFDRAGLDSSRFLAAVKPHGREIWSWFGLWIFLRISLTASFSRFLTHSFVKRPHQQSSPVYRAWICCSCFCPQLRSVLHLAWWVSRTYPTPLSDKVKQRIVLQTISAAANLQFLKLEQWTIDTLKHQQTWSMSISDSTSSIHPLTLYLWTTMIAFHHI